MHTVLSITLAFAANGRSAQTANKEATLPVTRDVSAPVVLYKVDPAYTEEARKAGYSGTVVLQLVVDTGGTARDIRVVRGLGLGLDEKAVEAVGKWRFRPGYRGGQPVAVQASVEVNFRLLDDAPTSRKARPGQPVGRADALTVPECPQGNEAYLRGDYATAFAQYLPLAEQGNAYAQVDLGTLYYHGAGVDQDYAKAVEWYKQAADAGVVMAYNNLGHCYHKGYGVRQDNMQAEMWFILAGASNDPEDSAARADVLANTTVADRAQSRNMAVEWLVSRGRPYVTALRTGGDLWTRESLVHSFATQTAIIPEKGISYRGAAVYATATRNRGRLWTRVCVWNVGKAGEVSVDPQQFWVDVTDEKKNLTLRAIPPSKMMSAGRTAATMQALVASLGSSRRTSSVTGVDLGTGDVYLGQGLTTIVPY